MYPGGTLNLWLYAGDFGLMDYRSRWYASDLGRFTQPDTIIPDFDNPQTMNRFSNVINNPINMVDPSGHRYCDWDADSGGCSDEGSGSGYGSDYDWDPRTWSYGGGGKGSDPSYNDYSQLDCRLSKRDIEKGEVTQVEVKGAVEACTLTAFVVVNGCISVDVIEAGYNWNTNQLYFSTGTTGFHFLLGLPRASFSGEAGLVFHRNVFNIHQDLPGKNHTTVAQFGYRALLKGDLGYEHSLSVDENGDPAISVQNNGQIQSDTYSISGGIDFIPLPIDIAVGSGLAETFENLVFTIDLPSFLDFSN